MSRVAYDHGAKRWVWRCDVCEKQAHWNDDWLWYGSWLDVEGGPLAQDIVTACSRHCMAEAKRSGKAPAHSKEMSE